MQVKILCISEFRDFNAWHEKILRGKELVVSEAVWNKLKQSDPDAFEELGKIVPKSSVKNVKKEN